MPVIHTVARHWVTRRAVRAAMLLSVVALPVSAQMPTVQQVFDKYADAVGGRALWAKVTDRSEIGTAEIAFAGVSGTYSRYYAAPNKSRMIIDLGVAKVEQGSDGKTVWIAQPGGDAAKMPPDDAAYNLEMSATGDAFLDPTRFAKSAVIGKDVFDGVECYKVELTTKSGRQRTDFFETATGLRRGWTVNTAAGPQTVAFKDYKKFEGKMLPTKIVQTNAQGDVLITVNTVTFTPNDPKLFELPAGVTP